MKPDRATRRRRLVLVRSSAQLHRAVVAGVVFPALLLATLLAMLIFFHTRVAPQWRASLHTVSSPLSSPFLAAAGSTTPSRMPPHGR